MTKSKEIHFIHAERRKPLHIKIPLSQFIPHDILEKYGKIQDVVTHTTKERNHSRDLNIMKNNAEVKEELDQVMTESFDDIFSIQEIEEIRQAFNADFKMSWYNIINCAKHEMHSKIASIIWAYVSKNKEEMKAETKEADVYNLDEEYEMAMIQYLQKKRKLGQDQTKYLRNLIQRARSFKPITTKYRG